MGPLKQGPHSMKNHRMGHRASDKPVAVPLTNGLVMLEGAKG
jgi:hypothetical protein